MKIFFSALASIILLSSQAQNLEYYLPKNVTYNSSIPTPESVIGHNVGEWHVTHDKLVFYMKALAAAAPDRIKLQTLGKTYENREQIALIITSPKNHSNLESIRAEHVKLCDANTASNTNNMPIVVLIGNSIHGNESSGSNASMLTAYYLAAAQGQAIEEVLNKVVILLDPSFNPDGLNRFASWANSHKSVGTLVSDPQSREYNEVWPGGRFNHYWFDLNRDWLPAQHKESQNRLKLFHDWKPNILTDHHEMGSNTTFFFQPGVPSRTNPNTPWKNQELTGAIGNFHAKYLDSIGSLYFSKEGYDDFYYGKGSTYPDINGAVGILFEQASSRGHAQDTENGLLTFPFTIRNQFVTSLSTIDAAKNLRKEMLDYQHKFFEDVAKEAAAYPVKGFIVGSENDKQKTNIFINMLLRHNIKIYPIEKEIIETGKSFKPGTSYIIPTNQQQFKIIKTVFEKTLEYKDSLFYDVTAWTMPLAFGLQYTELKNLPSTNTPITNSSTTAGNLITAKNVIGYAFHWNEFYAPQLLYNIQKQGLNTKVATQKFSALINGKVESFNYGSILIPLLGQSITKQQIENILLQAANEAGINIYGLETGLSNSGIDMGSNSLSTLKKPSVLLFAGKGTSATDVGEIWHLLDTRFKIPLTTMDVDRFDNANLNKYTTIIMASGDYKNLEKNELEKLKNWVSTGGTLIANEDATKFLANAGITKIIFKPAIDKKDSTQNLPYYLRSDEQRAKDLTGSIFEARMDVTHPLCYGYTDSTVSIFKSNTLFMDENNGAYDSPIMYTNNPLQSGYLYREYKNKIKNSAAVNIDAIGKGRVISIVDNLNFRAFWLGTSKIFLNSIFFADAIKL
jgi:hypothetical protein